MNLEICCIYDVKARAYLPPVFVTHIDVFMRSVRTAANTASHLIGQCPEDFHMFHLGTWSDDQGLFKLLGAPNPLGVAASLVVQPSLPLKVA